MVILAEKEIKLDIKNVELLILIVFLTVVLVFDARVTIKTPINFGDEGFHTRIAQWIGQNNDYFAWFPFYTEKDSKDGFGRPPLWNLTEAGFYMIFGFHEIIGKLLPPIIAFFTGLFVYLLIKELYNKEIGFIASVISVSIPSFVTYSVLLYTDVMLTFYFCLFVFTLLLSIKKNEKKYFYLSAVFASLAFLTKSPGLTVFVVLPLIILYELFEKKQLKNLIKDYSIYILIIFVILAGFFLRSFYYWGTPMCGLPLPIIGKNDCSVVYFKSELKFEGRTEQVGTEVGIFTMGLTNYLNFAYGKIWFVVFGLISGIILMLSKRDKFDILILLSLLSIFTILSQTVTLQRAEDTARYTLAWVPIISVVVGKYFVEIYNFTKKHIKDFALVVFAFVLVMSFLSLKEKTDAMIQVKQFSPMYFQACDWIKSNVPEDSLLMTVWSSRAVYNCQRNVVGNIPDISLSTDLNYTLNKTEAYGVTHLFIQKFSLSNEPLSEKYTVSFLQFLENNPEHFVNIFENGPKLQDCLNQGGCDGNIVYEVKY